MKFKERRTPGLLGFRRGHYGCGGVDVFLLTDKIVAGMAGVRLLSAAVEFTAALLMLRFGRVETAFKINAVLALVGPVVLLTVTSLGLIGLAGKVSIQGMAIIVLGVALIFIGINKF
ncbi:MAG: YqhV family protein [Peptococcaceae bacterium]|nr:YqhV family protein [Peptococcaceae bacterium]